jgi:hypothetical protein
MNGVMEIASEVRRTLDFMQRDQPVWLLRFPPVGQQTAPTDDRPGHWDKSHPGPGALG